VSVIASEARRSNNRGGRLLRRGCGNVRERARQEMSRRRDLWIASLTLAMTVEV
jgi:hypothetical protein